MLEYVAGSYDVAVVGAGHAGIEAALAAARLGCRTLLLTLSLDQVGNMPCNPAIGGPAKSHIVCELDALGGEMARAADATAIQARLLNRGKGAAVHSLRLQSDRRAYHHYMKRVLENTPNLSLRQGEVVALRCENGEVSGLVTALGAVFHVKQVVLATGTYLGGRIYIGEYSQEGGPDGAQPALALGENLRALGLPLRRFKTGTPARVHRASLDLDSLEVQPGEGDCVPFSADNEALGPNRAVCYIAYTNEDTHCVIRENLHRSPLFAGRIEGVGPRYCPSIEDKVVRFAEKERHQLFIEPMGLDTQELYLQGMSSSLPEEVQTLFYRSIRGLEGVELMRTAYAIEYDCIDPLALWPTLECKTLPGLFGAGQFNGTSGYEEAAAQGLIAGLNAARRSLGKPPVVLARDNSYIGALIDDLTARGTNEPYRMMTSRSEYRLWLRQDNAAHRLTPLGREVGLVDDGHWQHFLESEALREAELARLRALSLPPSPALSALLAEKGYPPATGSVKAAELLRRPRIGYDDLAPLDPARTPLSLRIRQQVETELKYEGYVKKQRQQIESRRRLERLPIGELDYSQVRGLRLEALEKLQKHRPATVGQAALISGVSPADVAVLLVYLKGRERDV